MKKSKKTLRQIIALMAIAFTTISLTACGGSDDDGGKDDLIAASEYLPGKEWDHWQRNLFFLQEPPIGMRK